jgi:hypothetical protein
MSGLAHPRLTGGLLAVASVAGVLSGPALAAASAARSSSDGTATAVTPARGVTYGGSTSSKDPVMVKLSRNGARVTQLSTQLRVTCSASGAYLPVVSGPRANLAIAPGGSFRGQVATTRDLGGGYSASQTIALSGKVRGLKLSGSVKVHADIVDPTHQVIDTCDRTVTFKAASSKAKVFAGVTSQGRPVVLELAASGALVHHFHIGWQASCVSGGSFSWGDTLTTFPIVRGNFGDAFGHKYSTPSGGSSVESYSIRGGISGSRAAGTFRWKEDETDATGAATDTCDTGRVSFRTSSG